DIAVEPGVVATLVRGGGGVGLEPARRASPSASVVAVARGWPRLSYRVTRAPARGRPSLTPDTHTTPCSTPMRACTPRSVTCTMAVGWRCALDSRRTVSARGLETRMAVRVGLPGRAAL